MTAEPMEWVGTARLDTIGLVIPHVDEALHEAMALPPEIRALGLLSSRTGAAGQILAMDEALKATRTRLIAVELPRDTKGWGGHGNYITLGAETVEDARRAVEMALALVDQNAGEVYISEAGHLEFAYSTKAGGVIAQAFGVPEGQAFGFLAGSPAAIGMVMADRAVKAAGVSIAQYWSPSKGTSHSNEVILAVYGEPSAVHESVRAGKAVGFILLSRMGDAPEPQGTPYIL